MRIDASGNVGIGTTNPGAALEVQNGWGNQFRISRSASPDQYSEITGGGSTMKFSSVNSDSTHSIFSFVSDNGTDELERMRIAANGNVGIGTTNPIYKLDVRSNAATWSAYIRNDNSDPYGLSIQYPTGSPSNAGNYYLQCFLGSATKFSVASNGDVVSNTNSYTSDDRVKHNEEIITGAIDTIKKITPKKYFKTSELYDADHDFDLNSDGNPIDENGEAVSCVVEAGVIAQEVLGVDELKFTVTPELKDEEGNISAPHSLNYNSLFTYAIAAIQEQQTIIEDLKARIEILENK
jgi:hypothetical protein